MEVKEKYGTCSETWNLEKLSTNILTTKCSNNWTKTLSEPDITITNLEQTSDDSAKKEQIEN